MPSWLHGSKQVVPQAPYFVQQEEPEQTRSRVRQSATRSTSDLGRVDETDQESDFRNTVPQRGSSRGTALPYLRSTPPPAPQPPQIDLPPVPNVPKQYAGARQNPRLRPAEFNADDGVHRNLQGRPLTPTASDEPSLPGSMPSPTASIADPGPPPAHGHPELPPVAPLKFKLMPHGRMKQVTEGSITTPSAALPDESLSRGASTASSLPPKAAQRQSSSAAAAPATQAPAAVSGFSFPAAIPPALQSVLMPQPPLGPQCQLFEFRYHSEAVPGDDNLWSIEMRYKVRINPEQQGTSSETRSS